MIMLHPMHHEGSSTIRLARIYATVTSSADNVDYCRLCLARSPSSWTRPLLRDTTNNLFTNQKQLNLANLPPRNAYRQDTQSQRRRENPHLTIYIFHLEIKSSKSNGRTIVNTQHPGSRVSSTHRPRNPIPWSSGKTTLSV